MVNRSSNTLKVRPSPYLVTPRSRGWWLTSISVTRAPDQLAIAPAGDVESLRGAHTRVGERKLPANREIVLENVKGNAMEIVAEIDTKRAPMVEMNVFRSPKKEEVTRIAAHKDDLKEAA